MISKILVPHDGTEMSDKALQKATELANAFKAQVVLLHVIEQIPVPPSLLLGNDTVLINRARRSLRRELEEAWNKMASLKIQDMKKLNVDVDATCECSAGGATEKIIQFAKKNKVDIIVMGSQRFKGVSKIRALGSVTRKVSEMTDCPVLIVH